MDTSLGDCYALVVKYVWLSLSRRLGRTIVTIVLLALGGAGMVTSLRVYNGLVRGDTGVEDSATLLSIYRTLAPGALIGTPVIPVAVFNDVVATSAPDYDVVGYALFRVRSPRDRSRSLVGELVTAGYFEVLGVRPTEGRSFVASDWDASAPLVVVVSERFLRRRSTDEPLGLGSTILLGQQTATVVGIVPESFRGTWAPRMIPTDVWLPARWVEVLRPDVVTVAGGRGVFIAKARPRNGDASVERLQQRLSSVPAGTAGDGRRRWYFHVQPEAAVRIHASVDRFAVPLTTIVLLLMAGTFLSMCVSVGSVMATHHRERVTDYVQHLVLGAQMSALVRRVIGEVCVVLAAAACLAAPLAMWVETQAVVLLLEASGQQAFLVRPDADALAIAVGAVLLLAVLVLAIGAPVCAVVRRVEPVEVVKGGASAAPPSGWLRTPAVALGIQAAVGVVFLAVAMALLTSGRAGAAAAAEDRVRSILVMASDDPTRTGKVIRDHRLSIGQAALEPGTVAAGLTDSVPLAGDAVVTRYFPDGQSAMAHAPAGVAALVRVTEGFLSAMAIGAAPPGWPTGLSSASVAAVSRQVATRLPAGASEIWLDGETPERLQILTVVEDLPERTALGVAAAGRGTIYLPADDDTPVAAAVLRYRSEQDARAARNAGVAARSDDWDMIATLHELLLDAQRPGRAATHLAGSGGVFLSLVTLVGLYGASASRVLARRGEIAVRVALGGSPWHVALGVAKPLVIAVSGGTMVGWSLIQAITAIIVATIPGSSWNVLPGIWPAIALAATGAAAALGPALVEARRSPMVALKRL